jgi:hypothetical protein
MSCSSFRQILAVLGHDDRSISAVLDRAIELADAERARLTLAKTTDPGRLIRWFAPAAISRAGYVAEFDPQVFARDLLARASEFVPASIPLTTVLLGIDTPCALRLLTAKHLYDLLVIDSALPGRSRKLRREIQRSRMCALMVSPDSISGARVFRPSPAGLLVR